jgi:hypothetical protein
MNYKLSFRPTRFCSGRVIGVCAVLDTLTFVCWVFLNSASFQVLFSRLQFGGRPSSVHETMGHLGAQYVILLAKAN